MVTVEVGRNNEEIFKIPIPFLYTNKVFYQIYSGA